jgi:hypothetical protein
MFTTRVFVLFNCVLDPELPKLTKRTPLLAEVPEFPAVQNLLPSSVTALRMLLPVYPSDILVVVSILPLASTLATIRFTELLVAAEGSLAPVEAS